MYMVGASLSEPHTSVTSNTSVTALRTCVCIYAWTDHLPKILNQRIQIFHDDGTYTPMCTSAKL